MAKARKAAAPTPASESASFATPADLRRWFAKHHKTRGELILVFHKVGCGTPSVTWPQSVDEALAVGWIDGVRRNVDATRYSIRFTPRRARSKWSAVNIRRVGELEAAGRMKPAGRAVFEARDAKDPGYSYERPSLALSAEYLALLKQDRAACAFLEARAPSYQRVVAHWVMAAKQEETRLRRLARLIAASAAGKLL